MKRRTTADFGPLDFTPLMHRLDGESYADPAVSFSSKDEALYFLDEVERIFGKHFLNSAGYWEQHTPCIYIPRLYNPEECSMSYTRHRGLYKEIPFSQLLIGNLDLLEVDEYEFDEILV